MKRETHQSSDGQTAVFKTFPEFSKLTLADKGAYEALIKDYPPLTDTSFAGLMLWWNLLDSAAISLLNGNIVISYWLPGDEANSGLSLIGTNAIDESICTIFDTLRDQGDTVRLVHVPECVTSNIQYPELFRFTPEPDYDEIVYDVSTLYPRSHLKPSKRARVEKFLSKAGGEEHVMLKSLDLRIPENQEQLLQCAREWRGGGFNFVAKLEEELLAKAIANADALDIENICLYVHGKLYSFMMYQLPTDKRYVIGTFIRIGQDLPGSTEFMFHACAGWFAERGIVYINFEQDLGIQTLRAGKLALGPTNFFRKYTITPA